MILLTVAAASASECTAELATYIEAIQASGDPSAYQCLIERDEAGDVLLEQATGETPRIRRALAVHWIHRLDEPLSAEVARALSASDRRLMADAVRARRGRKSPVPGHHEVFVQFDWYQPVEKYTDQRLSEIDRANIALIDDPPPPPKPEIEATAAEAIAGVAGTPVTERGCGGCGGGGVVGWWWVMGAAMVGIRRRQ